MNQSFNKLQELVTHAKNNTQMYRQLYSAFEGLKNLEDFSKLPLIDDDFLAGQTLKSMVSRLEDVFETRLPLLGLTPEAQVMRVINREEGDVDVDILTYYLKGENIDETKPSPKAFLVSDGEHLIGMGETAFNMCFLEYYLGMFTITSHTDEEIKKELERYKPELLLWGAQKKLTKDALPDSVKEVFTFNQPNTTLTDQIKLYNFYTHPLFGIIAVKHSKCPYYEFDTETFYVETTRENQVVITSLTAMLQPKIRYLTKDKGKIVGEGKFFLLHRGEMQK